MTAVLPWLIGIAFSLSVYYCVVQIGYPLIPTIAWAVPVGIAMVTGLLGHSQWTQLVGFIGLGAWLALYYYEPARRFWYWRLFRWRP
jgi:hypothetical protein